MYIKIFRDNNFFRIEPIFINYSNDNELCSDNINDFPSGKITAY